MAFKRKRGTKRRFIKRKVNRRGRRRRKGRGMVNMGPCNFPNKCTMNFRFCKQYGVSATVAFTQFVMFGNSIYDVETTGTNLTATPFVDANGIWTRFGVISSSITILVSNNLTTPMKVYLVPYDFLGIGVLDSEQWMENNNVKYTTVDGNTRGGKSFTTIKMRSSSKKLLNIRYNDDRNMGFLGATPVAPSMQWFWVVGFRALGGSTINATISVRMDYKTLLSSRVIVEN